MTAKIRIYIAALALAVAFASGLSLSAQQSAQPDIRQLQAYDLKREVSLVGNVVKFDPASSVAPVGAHVLLQTASGQIDVHLGSAKLLKASQLELKSGDTVRILGESLALENSTFFAARIVQKGTQVAAVRNTKGFLLTSLSSQSAARIEALRGVR